MADRFFTDQATTGFTYVLSTYLDAATGTEFFYQMRFSGSDFEFGEARTPVDGLYNQISFELEYTEPNGGDTVLQPVLQYTGPTQDLSDLFDQYDTPAIGMSYMLLALVSLTTGRLPGDAGVSILANAPGGQTSGTRNNDVINVSDDNSWFSAGWGDDYMVATGGPVRFKGQAGDDHLIGADGHDILRGGSGHDSIEGQAGDDKIYGQSGNDALRGGAGDDWVLGGSGRDYLIAGAGRDQLSGGTGADMFIFNIATEDTALSAHNIEDGRNVVRDFDFAEDVLRFGVGYNNTLTQADAFAWFSEHATDAGDKVRIVDGNVRIIIKNASVGDFSIEHFAGSDTHGNYDAWLLG
ncbi:Leukotoxin [Ascidiaceihabitans donghaensis]|uniref:Leukotoxin n=1 Tax=Ascidiaceihabitans donghaensis TaxID=1510460 RepID=A0A2R8BCR4_9RHOB|nr:calcium-binding protein [Ascidiaceihabitans donghaensis]SPH20738.1 Leukotoxin [Ascidiaceihabitans donghaensis]